MQLFQPARLGDIDLKNRVVMAPMTRCRNGSGHLPGPMVAAYYGQRAGAGLIVTEGTSPSPNGLGYPRIPGIFSDAQVAGWRAVTEIVHAQDARIFMQLMHTGRVAHESNLPEGGEVLAPSAVELPGEIYSDVEGMQPHTPAKAMTAEDIIRTREEFVQAARNAVSAGFDGIELHAANGYLAEQFIHPHTNRRSDAYGGSVENRARFVLEIVEGMIGVIGKARVGIRLSPYGVFNDMPHYPEIDETYRYLAQQLDRLGVVYIHLVDHSAMGAPPVPDAIKQAILALVNSSSHGGQL